MSQGGTLKISCHQCKQKLDVSSLEPFSQVTCPVCNADLIVPKWFDSYLLTEPGSSGGMATVYHAHDPALDREIAIKILSPEYSNDPMLSHQFLQEARTAAMINHHAIVAIYTCGVFQGQCYIVMQYLPGGTLEELLRQSNGKLPIETVTAWIRDVAEGLENAQKYGIVHHDIKPGNILLDSEGNAKIGDFGLAQMLHSPNAEQADNSAFSRFWVSPNYVSPEKVRTNEEDYRGDIYSLGATFYHLLTGSTPFSHSDMDELIRMRLTEAPMPPHFHRAEINLELSQLIMAMLAKNPDDRPSYRTIIGVLNRILKNHSASTVPLPVRELRKNKTPMVFQESPDAKKLQKTQSYTRILLFILIPVSLVLITAVYFVYRGTNTVRQQTEKAQLIPDIAGSFSTGNIKTAAKQAEAAALNRTLPDGQRLLAAYQYACALYLQKKPDPEKLSILLAQMQLNTPEQKWKSLWIPLKQMCTPGKKLRITEREGASIPLMAFTDFLILAAGSSNRDEIFKSFRSLQTQLATIPANHWIRLCWEHRFPLWQNILEYGITSDTTVEPLFRIGIRQTGPGQTNTITQSANNKTGLNSDADDFYSSIPDVSETSLRAAAERYKNQNRPYPGAPCSLTRHNTQDYLESLSAEDRAAEKKRLIFMCNLIPYIVPAAENHPYQTPEFVSLDGKIYRNGQLIFNRKFVSFKNDTGLQRIEWDQIPSGEIRKILKYYVAIREKRDHAAVEPKRQQELAAAYVRYAMFCQWYGMYEEAQNYAIRTLKYLPGNSTNKLITQWLLQ